MATGIQGPRCPKDDRGVQGATGWCAIGSETEPTGPTGPIGSFSNRVTQSETSLTLYGSNVSTLYSVTTNSQITLGFDTSFPVGGYFVFTNQTISNASFSFVGGSIDGGGAPVTLAPGRAVMLIRLNGNNLASSYLYSGRGGLTGTVRSIGA